MGGIGENIILWQWGLVIGSSLLLFFFSPLAKTTDAFFKAATKDKQPNWLLLTGSLVISWVFAKSITNAADLGHSYGVMGGLAYAAYYFSFIVAGVVIYFLRKKGDFTSIHHFLQTRFGKGALVVFSVVIAFRLFNEVWSNTMVIGNYFGEQGSAPYYWSIILFTLLTLAYSLKGGLKSSIFSDAIQMGLFAILLAVILSFLLGNKGVSAGELMGQGEFSWAFGLNLLLAALIQSLSYPFHDPVLTDRGFISPVKTTLRSFIAAGIIGGICIFLFSFLGIFGRVKGIEAGALTEVGMVFGPVMLLLINFIMIVSAASTLDSTFSSFSKLAAVDLKWGHTVKFGRITMIIVAIAGTLPIFLSPAILSATTVSGTMVMGLAPVFLFWSFRSTPLGFYLSVGTGILLGTVLAFQAVPDFMIFTEGPYNDLLGVNVFGVLLCTLLFFFPNFFIKRDSKK